MELKTYKKLYFPIIFADKYQLAIPLNKRMPIYIFPNFKEDIIDMVCNDCLVYINFSKKSDDFKPITDIRSVNERAVLFARKILNDEEELARLTKIYQENVYPEIYRAYHYNRLKKNIEKALYKSFYKKDHGEMDMYIGPKEDNNETIN